MRVGAWLKGERESRLSPTQLSFSFHQNLKNTFHYHQLQHFLSIPSLTHLDYTADQDIVNILIRQVLYNIIIIIIIIVIVGEV